MVLQPYSFEHIPTSKLVHVERKIPSEEFLATEPFAGLTRKNNALGESTSSKRVRKPRYR